MRPPAGSGPSTTLTGLAAAALGAAVTWAAHEVLAARPPGGGRRWTRTNHAGAAVTLLEGPAVVAGCVVGCAGGGLVAGPAGYAAAAAALVAGGLGALDDLAGEVGPKGLRGHLGALRRGRVTTGALKVGGLAAVGVGVALTRRGVRPPTVAGGAGPTTLATVVRVVVDAGVVAGSANLVNLLDLRPGRALKVVVALGAPLAAAGSAAAAGAVGSALAALPGDLAGRRMLGDTGANATGAVLGAAAVDRLGPRGRGLVVAGLVALTLASERVSFTRVIEATPVLRELDGWGRQAGGRHREPGS